MMNSHKIIFIIFALFSNFVLAEQPYKKTGYVNESSFTEGVIIIDSQSYKLTKNIPIHGLKARGEHGPSLPVGTLIGFNTDSDTGVSNVIEIWLLQ